jgi:hypothetical protein
MRISEKAGEGGFEPPIYLIQSFVPAPAKPTNELAAGRPISADETDALPELTLEGRIAVALALRGVCRIRAQARTATIARVRQTRRPFR